MAELLLSVGPPLESLPDSYIRPASQLPNFAAVETDENIPVIDLGSPDKSQIAAQVGQACQSYEFFQVVNHGISDELIQEMQVIGAEFFRLPAEEKLSLYSDDPAKKVRLSTSFNVKKEKVHNWRDYLRLHCHPLEEYLAVWPSKPLAYREVVSEYCREVRRLGFLLLGFVSLSLGLEQDYIEKVFGDQEQHMAINYYPPCPEPDLTYGLPSHTDPNGLTVLLQDPHVAGLQVLRSGKWIAVNPQPNAFVVNIGDQLQKTRDYLEEQTILSEGGDVKRRRMRERRRATESRDDNVDWEGFYLHTSQHLCSRSGVKRCLDGKTECRD